MVDLVLAFSFTAIFAATVSPHFWSDTAKLMVAILNGFILASVTRDIATTQAFLFDQHFAFAVGAAVAIFALTFSSDNFPPLLVALLSLWLALEILALLFLQHLASTQDYMDQQTIAYVPALVIAWIAARLLWQIRSPS